MNALEFRVSALLSAVFALRMAGLFMLLPVLSVYASDSYSNASVTLIGCAIGAYGLTQALFQIPAGLLSDYIGRKPVILIGLVLFGVGSLVAAISDSIYGVILGRCLQGSGAIAAAISALIADVTREEKRSRAMAMVGMSIGLSFCLSMVLGPLIAEFIGVKGLFSLIGILTIPAMAIVFFAIPTPVVQKLNNKSDTITIQLSKIFHHPELIRLNVGVFILHFILMGLFVTLPLNLQNNAGLVREHHWLVYLSTMVLSFVVVIFFIILGEKKHIVKEMLNVSVCLLLVSQIIAWFEQSSLFGLILSVFVFFVAFNYLEASLPSLVSKQTQANSRGAAMGLFGTCQFLGAGLGGVVCGFVYQYFGQTGVLILCAILTVFWQITVVTMRQPSYASNIILKLFPMVAGSSADIQEQVQSVLGVMEATVISEEKSVYLKVNKKLLDVNRLKQFGEWKKC